MTRRDWQPGKLWERLQVQTQQGLDAGALLSIATQYEWVESAGVTFLVRVVENLARKSQATPNTPKKAADFDPFLPYEADLYVSDISDTHLCLLNKFNVVDHHLLIVTRAFEPQTDWLNLADFEALSRCLGEIDGFAFYNGGTVAGASQRHKHLQLVPLPMVEGGPGLLVDQIGLNQGETLPFFSAIAPLPSLSGQALLDTYHQLLARLGKAHQTSSKRQTNQPVNSPWEAQDALHFPYNLLCTRRWMMMVPRSQESYGKISINALGFAGSLLVKNQDLLTQLKAVGPMAVLQQVGIAR